MPTIGQLGRKARIIKFRRLNRSRALVGCPQKRGVVIKVREMKPKKPNSAKRKIARVRLSTKRIILAYVMGIETRTNIREFSQVLVRGGHVKDLPGIQYHLIKGKFDFGSHEGIVRMHSLTRYGIPIKPLDSGNEKPYYTGKDIFKYERIMNRFYMGPIRKPGLTREKLKKFRPIWLKKLWVLTPPELANTLTLLHYIKYY